MNTRVCDSRAVAWLSLACSLLLACSGRIGGSNTPERESEQPSGVSSAVVDLGGGVVGTLTRPTAPGSYPAVLMLHGFGSDRDEVGEMFERTAEKCAAEGMASLRIDFRGSGDSVGEFRAATIDTRLADAERALVWLLGHEAIDGERIGVLGFSLGAAIAILVGERYGGDIASMVVWSPLGDLRADFAATLGEEAFAEARREGVVTRDLGWRRVTLEQGFFASLERWDVARSLRGYGGAFLAIAGSDDPLARHARPLAQSIDGMAVFVREADHVFNATSRDNDRSDTAIEATVVHFSGTLKWKKGSDGSEGSAVSIRNHYLYPDLTRPESPHYSLTAAAWVP